MMQAGSRKGTRYPFSFTGSGGEYFKIWIVNILLSILTLYIYSAWAKVRTKRYFAGNTVLDNSSFDYHATGKQILIGRIIAVVLLIVLTLASAISPVVSVLGVVAIALLAPWAVWRSVKFNMRMTSFRNVRFGFDGRLGPMYLYMLVFPLLPLLVAGVIGGVLYFLNIEGPLLTTVLVLGFVSAYLIYPWVHKRLAGYLLQNYRYGTAKFSGELSTGRFYALYLKSLGLSVLIYIAVLAAAGILFGIAYVVLNLDLQSIANDFDDPEELGALGGFLIALFFVFLYLFFFIFGTLVSAYFRARLRQHLLGEALLDGRVDPESTLTARGLWWVSLSNIVVLVLTLGLAYPWAKVRMARYYARNSAVYSEETLDNFVDNERQKIGALGEEFGDAFDLDVDVGF